MPSKPSRLDSRADFQPPSKINSLSLLTSIHPLRLEGSAAQRLDRTTSILTARKEVTPISVINPCQFMLSDGTHQSNTFFSRQRAPCITHPRTVCRKERPMLWAQARYNLKARSGHKNQLSGTNSMKVKLSTMPEGCNFAAYLVDPNSLKTTP